MREGLVLVVCPQKDTRYPSYRNTDDPSGRGVFVYRKAILFKTLLARRQEFYKGESGRVKNGW